MITPRRWRARSSRRFRPARLAGLLLFHRPLACARRLARAGIAQRGRGPAESGRGGTKAELLASPDQWNRLDQAVDRGLAFIARRQQRDGSFPTFADGQPGVTSLCVLALLARGHQPGKDRTAARSIGPSIMSSISRIPRSAQYFPNALSAGGLRDRSPAITTTAFRG